MVFPGLASPHVAAGPRRLAGQGWNVRIYHSMQIMAVAWRGDVQPIDRCPDHRIEWSIAAHLEGLA